MDDIIGCYNDASQSCDSNWLLKNTDFDFDFDLDSIPESLQKKEENCSSTDARVEIEGDEECVDPTLLRLQLRKNESRNHAKLVCEKEGELMAIRQKNQKTKQRRVENSKVDQFKKGLESAGVESERFARLHETQDQLKAKSKKKKVIGDIGSFGISDSDFKISFERRNKASVFDMKEYSRQADKLGDDAFYSRGIHSEVIQHVPKVQDVNSLIEELEEQQQRRDNFHRRRSYKDEKDVTYINQMNKQYNKRLSRHYDPFTQEIKDNLERGTAL